MSPLDANSVRDSREAHSPLRIHAQLEDSPGTQRGHASAKRRHEFLLQRRETLHAPPPVTQRVLHLNLTGAGAVLEVHLYRVGHPPVASCSNQSNSNQVSSQLFSPTRCYCRCVLPKNGTKTTKQTTEKTKRNLRQTSGQTFPLNSPHLSSPIVPIYLPLAERRSGSR